MPNTSLYEVLGVSKGATTEEISKAYRHIAIENHPDKNPSPEATERFKRASEAYEILSDEQRRRHYDTYGSQGRGNATEFHVDPMSAFGDLFRDMFGGGVRRSSDTLKEVQITLVEAFTGTTKEVSSFLYDNCSVCSGSGVTEWEFCAICGGNGVISTKKGDFAVRFTCTHCAGQGRIVKTRCEACHGDGRIPGKTKKHQVTFPSGIEDGVQIVLRGAGNKSGNLPPGDLVCKCTILPHELYERDGGNLYCTVPITYAQSLLGLSIDLPLISSDICTLTIPPGVKSGNVLRLPGLGMPVIGRTTSRGDLLVRVAVESPSEPTTEYLDLVKKLAEIDDKQKYERIKEFGARLKSLRQ